MGNYLTLNDCVDSSIDVAKEYGEKAATVTAEAAVIAAMVPLAVIGAFAYTAINYLTDGGLDEYVRRMYMVGELDDQ